MRLTKMSLVVGGIIAIAACNSETTAPVQTPEQVQESQPIDLIGDFGATAASDIDGAGIGGSSLPDSLKLTTEQKAKIEELHAAFRTARAADLAALEAIEKEARAARDAGKSKEEVKKILDKAIPIRARLMTAFLKLVADIKAVYTPAQLAWINAHPIKECGPNGRPELNEAQIAAIRNLRKTFLETTNADREFVKKIAKEAEEARKAGKSSAEVKAILAKADPARVRIDAAESKLRQAILDLLTPKQRLEWCRINN